MRSLTISKQITNRENPALSKYLNDISRIPMITVDEEVELAIRIRNGDAEALEKLIVSNLRFVVSVAKQYQSRGLNLHDLINEGNLGLVKAASKFDETRGFKFISYAVWWIRQGIIQAVSEKSRIVRLPLNKINVINKINGVTAKFEQSHQRPPTADEMSELIDFSISEIQLCLEHTSWSISMDKSLRPEEEGFSLHDLIESENIDSPEHDLINRSLQIEIEGVMDLLSNREAYVIKMLYGIGGGDPLGMEQIANDLDITTERVRQLKTKALTKLRDSSKANFLREFIN
ncbi:sigma-70 family RNA polymerase sigma factor [Flagellimonas zhangzhouensis]|uniref:RNA polymerase primary sigma factor n=1 Tax=Flagellimonas zhangzhouensis TaxID=1073328 RepID=A0A1H2S772_9FLAO|nr:RNA polymerase sigma factor RpoD/SigA [Allomuricauda zhangzhouensis]SDQ71542.1 RNA polymerase primary sigma factor [Allomuricauda zhangzhouensis]SDW27463.1 RNA polymerase primary sigma factor [Allomuricauda zhangzhouensis]